MPRFPIALLVAAFAAAGGATASAQEAPKARPGAALSCPAKLLGTDVATTKALRDRGISATGVHTALVRRDMAVTGIKSQAPSGEQAAQRAAQASWLALNGHVVAAKVINDASMKVPGYRGFGEAMEMHLTVLTQPVNHAIDEASAANHEDEHAGHGHDHSGGIAEASAALNEIIGRAAFASKAMGAHYQRPAVRLYLLGHGFHDSIAIEVTTDQVCALGLAADVIEKLNVSARFMAMPAKSSKEKK